jgi:hypothetical protein
MRFVQVTGWHPCMLKEADCVVGEGLEAKALQCGCQTNPVFWHSLLIVQWRLHAQAYAVIKAGISSLKKTLPKATFHGF